jgi:hypothetical protein
MSEGETTNVVKIADYETDLLAAALIDDDPAREQAIRRIKQVWGVGLPDIRKRVDTLRKNALNNGAAMGLPPPAWLTKLNETYAVYKADSSFRVVNIRGDGAIRLLTVKDFKDEVSPMGVNVGKAWLESPARREVGGFVVDPSLPPEAVDTQGRLNLWRGWGVEPVKGNVGGFLHYIYTVFPDDGDYILDWCAWVLQNPARRAATALYLIGQQGTGKTKLGDVMMALFGAHGLFVDDAEQFAGRFNAHMGGKLFVLGDEVTFAGDGKKADKAKSRITGRLLSLEGKGRDIIMVENQLSFLLTSNHDHAAKVEVGDRRYAMIEASDALMQNTAYFRALDDWREAGGDAHILHYLLHRDLSKFDAERNRPRSQVRADNIRASLTPVFAWMQAAIDAGNYPRGQNYAEIKPGWVDVTDVYSAFTGWANTQKGVLKVPPANMFWKEANRVWGALPLRRPRLSKDKQAYERLLPDVDVLEAKLKSFMNKGL